MIFTGFSNELLNYDEKNMFNSFGVAVVFVGSHFLLN